MKMKTLMLGILLCITSISLFAQEYTVKQIVTEVTTTDKLVKFLESAPVIKYVNLLDNDLKISFVGNTITITSKDAFKYVKFNGQNTPKNASTVIDFFDTKIRVTKKGNTITVQKL